MDKDKLKQVLLSKDVLWRDIFLTMFLRNKGLLESDLGEKSYDVTICLKMCHNENDYENICCLVEFVDENYDEIKNAIDFICVFKSAAWQYDFVTCVSQVFHINIVQDLSAKPVIIAICWCLALPIEAIAQLTDSLDCRYKMILSSLANKEGKLKRNFLLTLECSYEQRLYGSIDSFTFREIVDEYVQKVGTDKLIEVLKSVRTEETRLSDDEINCMALAYYSPFYDDAVTVSRNLLPQGSLFQRVYEYMSGTSKLWKFEREKSLTDEDYDALTEAAVYVDATEMCLIDVHMEDNFYANVYIKRQSKDDMFNDYSDFVVFDNGFLYTVEFVDDFNITQYTREFVKQLMQYKQELQTVLSKLKKLSPKPSEERSRYLQRQDELSRYICSCYYTLP